MGPWVVLRRHSAGLRSCFNQGDVPELGFGEKEQALGTPEQAAGLRLESLVGIEI